MEFEQLKKEIKQLSLENNIPLIPTETGEILKFFATLLNAKNILEIGTGLGYSATWLLEGSKGNIISIEKDLNRANLAKDFFAQKGIKEIKIINGDALEVINSIEPDFDLIFQDGPKGQYINMLERLIYLLKPGGILITDNVAFRGFVDKNPKGRFNTIIKRLKEYNTAIKKDKRLYTIVLPIGDGIALSQKRRD